MPLSAEAEVLLAPASAWPRIAQLPSGHWVWRPALALLILAASVSLMTSGRLTARLVAGAMICGSFVPALEIASLAVACRRSIPWRRAVELFFAGHGPWSLWLLASAALWGFVPAPRIYPYAMAWRVSACAPFLWSAYIDYWFFRAAAGRSAGGAARDLVVQRLIAWAPGAAIFVAPAGWQVVASALGL